VCSSDLTSEWGSSISVRTPNDETKPLDYELSIKLNDTNGKFQYLLKRDWERELGEKYIDDARKTLPNNGVQGIISPIIEMENNKEYFLVIQKGFQFITDSETVITAFDKAPRRSTPGKGYSA